MRLGRIFWGINLMVLGGLFFLQNMGLLSDVFGWFGPIFLIMLGIWVLTSRMMPRTASKEDFSIDLQGATQVAFELEHGAGAVQLTSGAPAGVAATGTQAEGIEVQSNLVGDRLDVKIEAGPGFIPFIGPDGGVWCFRLGQGVPTTLDVEAGATSLDFDLNDLNITSMKFELGASTLKLKMPANVPFTRLDINSGAATLDLSIPQGVALRLRATLGVSSFDVDQSRFPMQSTGFYQSADYESAANKAEINLDGGANAVKVW